MDLTFATLLSLAFFAALFALAMAVERRGASRQRAPRPRVRRAAHALALGVYCSSWTFYGAVGSAVRDGWNYLPVYLAPIALLVAAPRLLRRLAEAVARERAVTVSDFIAARFGHDIVVARLVTVIALCASIPYVALQLRSVGTVMEIVSGRAVAVPAMLGGAALMAAFAMLYGARQFDLAGRSEGLLYVIGADSAFKLLTMAGLAALAGTVLWQAPPAAVAQGWQRLGAGFSATHLSAETLVIALLSAGAILSLPRQFFVGLVEAAEPDDLAHARWSFAGYLALTAALILPIALAGLAVLGPGVSPDLFVLALPAHSGGAAAALLLPAAMLGGLSAAASMAIVDATALATMVSNDLVFPSVLKRAGASRAGELGRRMAQVRRGAILAIMLAALAWALLVAPGDTLASLGLVAFAGMAQFTPHLLLATTGAGRDPLAARASLCAGLVLWAWTLALPPVLPLGWMAALAGTLADPHRLFALGSASPLVHGALWSLGVNLAVYSLVAARAMPPSALPRFLRQQRPVSDRGELVDLVAGFVGRERAEAQFAGAAKGVPIARGDARMARDLIAQVVGAASARALVASALAEGTMSLQAVTRLLDEGGQSLRFSRGLLAATFENIEAAISVVDAQMHLVAWNSRYLELFDYPPGMVRVGVPVEELMRHNAVVGMFGHCAGPEQVEAEVARRMAHLQRGREHRFERRRADGRVIRIAGGPMPGGGYVTSFTDVTGEARAREELRRTLDELETRVAARTRDLSEANARLAQADREKTRFLAAASHDLLQPIHAARLFTAALSREAAGPAQGLVARLEGAITAADDLLRALLDISRIDAGGVTAEREPLVLAPFLTGLAEGFRPQAEAKGLDLRIGPLPGAVETDPGLLRSIMQNFLANALRYTPAGAVLIGVRRRGDGWRIDVIDTGVGIAADKHQAIFEEFTRLGEVDTEGQGLGLALVERLARVLGGQVEVQSAPGRGSRFSLLLPGLVAQG